MTVAVLMKVFVAVGPPRAVTDTETLASLALTSESSLDRALDNTAVRLLYSFCNKIFSMFVRPDALILG